MAILSKMPKYSPLRNKFEYLNQPKPNTTNEEGFGAWKQPLEGMYIQLLTTEMFGNTYYCKEEDRLKVGVEVIRDYVNKDPVRAAEIAMEARNKYYMRTMPILATVFLSTKLEGLHFNDVFKEVIRTPRDAIQFIDLCRSGVVRKGLGRKLKKAMGKLIHSWLETKGEFYATKYKNQIATMTKLSHPVINSAILDYIMDKPREGVKLPTIDALNEIKSGELNDAEIVARIVAYKLDWNTVKGIMKPNNFMWKYFLMNMSMIAFIKNIATALRHLDVDDVLDLVRERLTIDNLERGKVLPIRLMQAYKMASVPDIQRYLGLIANDYARKYNMSNLGRVAICPDISGSMTTEFEGKFSYAELAGMYSGVLAKAIPNSIMMPWDNGVYVHDFETKDGGKRWRDVVFMYNYCRSHGGGGTAMYAPVQHLINHNIKIDTFILLTDSEEWVNYNWVDIWKIYLQKVNRNAKAILIRSDSYITTQPYPPEIAKQYNIYQMYGYADQVFKLLTQI